jgi:hypothetical protein
VIETPRVLPTVLLPAGACGWGSYMCAGTTVAGMGAGDYDRGCGCGRGVLRRVMSCYAVPCRVVCCRIMSCRTPPVSLANTVASSGSAPPPSTLRSISSSSRACDGCTS